MPDPRGYTKGTRAALFSIAQGHCYAPGCDVEVVKHLETGPEIAVEIAHISAAYPNGKRYDSSMTDTERAAFANLILLCTAHHKAVDKDGNETTFTVEVLNQWKRDREGLSGTGDTGPELLQQVPERDIEEMLGRALSEFTPHRAVELDLVAVLQPFRGPDGLAVPFADVPALRGGARTLAEATLRVVASARVVGTLDVSIESFELRFGHENRDGPTTRSIPLRGHNDFAGQNPSLPRRVKQGDALAWHWSQDTLDFLDRGLFPEEGKLVDIRARVTMRSGETVDSEPVAWDAVRAAIDSRTPPAPDPRHEARRARWRAEADGRTTDPG
ncbi:hypothetical protein [Frigoribacterium sp. NPDC087798]|uniref:hypothetical protein n=1 Tax=Frigoribacterium sp. NPDC087798 TaxID=3363993 RepID=UPI00382139AD